MAVSLVSSSLSWFSTFESITSPLASHLVGYSWSKFKLLVGRWWRWQIFCLNVWMFGAIKGLQNVECGQIWECCPTLYTLLQHTTLHSLTPLATLQKVQYDIVLHMIYMIWNILWLCSFLSLFYGSRPSLTIAPKFWETIEKPSMSMVSLGKNMQ